MALFSKKTSESEPEPTPGSTGATAYDPARPAGKGRPTPKRREAEAARRRPLVTDPKTAKDRQRSERLKAREAMMSGNEKYLPERDKGPSRRFLRDAVDSRLNLGEILLPAMLVVLAISLVPDARVKLVGMILAYALIFFAIIDLWYVWRRARKAHIAAFGTAPEKGSALYTTMRATQMRSARVPRPAIARGDELRRR